MNREEYLEAIVKMEWSMMKKIDNISGKVYSLKDEVKFKTMRKSQFEIWSLQTLESYLRDLTTARDMGRNILEEKYAYMMESTDPEKYAEIKKMLPSLSDEKLNLIRELTDMIIEDELILAEKYPMLVKREKVIFSKDCSKRFVSLEIYYIGELKTYTKKTIYSLKVDYQNIKYMGKNIAEENLISIVRKWGYESLEEAEKSTNETK